MKHIILEGAKHSGKSSTISALVQKLKPTEFYEEDGESNGDYTIDTSKLLNRTYFIKCRGEIILVVAGAPTEQMKTITSIVESAQKHFDKEITFAIIAKRRFEKRAGYDTILELQSLSEEVHRETICRIAGTTKDTLQSNAEFIERVERIYNITINNLSK